MVEGGRKGRGERGGGCRGVGTHSLFEWVHLAVRLPFLSPRGRAVSKVFGRCTKTDQPFLVLQKPLGLVQAPTQRHTLGSSGSKPLSSSAVSYNSAAAVLAAASSLSAATCSSREQCKECGLSA